MKIKGLGYAIILLTLVVTLCNLGGLVYDSFFYNLNDLPTGEPLFSAMSPDGKKTVKIYKVEIDSLGTAVRGELISVDPQNKTTSVRNIYWQTGKATAIVSWINETTVSINNHAVSIQGEGYDSRRQIELPEASTKNRILNDAQ